MRRGPTASLRIRTANTVIKKVRLKLNVVAVARGKWMIAVKPVRIEKKAISARSDSKSMRWTVSC